MPNVSNVPKIFIFKRFFDHSITNGILASHSYEEVILKYEQFLITHLSITQRGPQFIPVQLRVSLLSQLNRNSYQYSICNQTDRRCLLHRVIRSFHGYLEATGRPRACTCARVPWQKSQALCSGRTRGRALLSLISCSLVLLFAPSSLVSIPINAVIRSAKSNFNWRLDKDTRCVHVVHS